MSAPSTSPYYEARARSAITRVSLAARTRVYELFIKRFGDAKSILDLGVTGEQMSIEANFLEKLYPHKERIIAAGIEDASFLVKAYPGIRFVAVEAGKKLPFADNEFDVAFSHAVIEHVVGEEARRFFLSELIRVCRNVFITTPNKFFPIEVHTFLPLIHFIAPSAFYFLLDRKIVNRFYNSSNLSLLSAGKLKQTVLEYPEMHWEFARVRTLGWPSNLIAIGSKK